MCRGYWAMRALAVSGRKFERGLIGGGHLILSDMNFREEIAKLYPGLRVISAWDAMEGSAPRDAIDWLVN